jgi:4,5-dihydroxyphthalate decarboxylase
VDTVREPRRALLGPDPWSHGVVPNKHTIEVFVDYCHRQHLLTRRLLLEEIFPENLLDSAG